MFFLGSAPMRAGFVEKLSAQLLLGEPFTGDLAFGDLHAPVDLSCVHAELSEQVARIQLAMQLAGISSPTMRADQEHRA
jgi:hypothetical protein